MFIGFTQLLGFFGGFVGFVGFIGFIGFIGFGVWVVGVYVGTAAVWVTSISKSNFKLGRLPTAVPVLYEFDSFRSPCN